MIKVDVSELTFAELKSIYYDLGEAWAAGGDLGEPWEVTEIECSLTDGTYFPGKSVTWDYPTLYPELWDLLKSKSDPKK